MASLKDIRARIETTKNTQQITKAMKLVSAAKLRRAQANIVNMRPYSLTLRRVIADLAATKKATHPLMEPNPQPKKVLLVVISSDRGLCGAFNANVIKYAENILKTEKKNFEVLDLFIVGRKATDYFLKRGYSPIKSILRLDKDISYKLASEVADSILQGYLDGNYESIKIIYNEFKSAIAQNVVCEKILPIDESLNSFDGSNEGAGSNQNDSGASDQNSLRSIPPNNSGVGFSVDMIFEPGPEKIIEQLLVKHFELQVYRCMSESVASEHGARMTAMENATSNAKAMIESLTLTYNKIRQEKITTELTEIVSGAEALK